jgi:hypothetical protein
MEKSSGDQTVRTEIAIVAGPREWGDTRESWLARVPRRVSTVTFRTVKALWYGEITDPEHWAARDIREAAEQITERRSRERSASYLETLADRARSVDPDFYGEVERAYLDAARLLREMDRA